MSITKVELQVIDDKLLIDAILADKLPAEVCPMMGSLRGVVTGQRSGKSRDGRQS